MTLLVVEDEGPAAFLRQGFAFHVDVAGPAGSADEAVAVNEYDAIVLDVMLPGGRVFAVPPVAPGWLDDTDPVPHRPGRDRRPGAALDLGADDYLVKPFALAELLARVRPLLRRAPALPRRRSCGWPASSSTPRGDA